MHRIAVALLLVAGLVLGTPQAGHAQAPARTAQVELQQNYPNPFNPATTIPFRLSEAVFANGHRPVVSMRIYNVLAQLVVDSDGPGLGRTPRWRRAGVPRGPRWVLRVLGVLGWEVPGHRP